MIPVLSISLVVASVQSSSISVKPLKTVEGVHVEAFAAGPKGSLFAAALENKSVEIIDASNRNVLRKMTGHPQPAMAIAWSEDGELIASGDESARIITWNAETGAKLHEMRGHQRGIENLAFNYARNLLASTGKDDMLKLWDPGTGKELREIPGQGANFYGGEFRGKTDNFGVGILGIGAREYDLRGKATGFYVGHGGQGVFDIAYNAAGTRAVTAGRDGTAIVWDAKTKQKLGSLKGHSDWVVHCAFSPNGKWIATSGDDRTVRIWNPYNFQQVAILNDQSAVGSPLCWTADGKYLITSDFGDNLEVNAVTPAQGALTSEAPVHAHAHARHRKH